MILWLTANTIFVLWCSAQWYLYGNTAIFFRHYLLSVGTLLGTASFAFLLAALWPSQVNGIAGIAVALLLLAGGAMFAVLAISKGGILTETRLLPSGRWFRSLIRIGVVPLDFSVQEYPAVARRERTDRIVENITLVTKDGVRLRGFHIQSGFPTAVIIAHGSFRSKDAAPYVLLSQLLAYKHDVVAFDFRGHGESGGHFDFGNGTVIDLKRVVDYTRSKGYEKVGVFGRSMGAWTGIIEGAQYQDVDSIVAAASPLHQITDIDTAQRFVRVASTPLVGGVIGRFVYWLMSVVRGTRMATPRRATSEPLAVIADIAPIPLLLIYQEWDRVIKTDVADAHLMLNTAGEPKRLLVLAGPGHIFEVHQFHRLCSVIDEWFDDTLRATHVTDA